jgi:aryl-alcohol dehydrogenase-like predicted oxidoreductase
MDLRTPSDYPSKLGIGSVQFGTKYGISNLLGQTTSEEVERILDTAIANRINFIDTASAYGNAEKVLGQNILSGFNIVSKYVSPSKGGSIDIQVKNSLNDLRIERLYGYLAHNPMTILDEPEQWEDLLNLKKCGLVGKIGFSLYEPYELEVLLKEGFYPDLVQVPFNYFDQRFENHLIELKKNGCEVHVRSVFLQGLFFAKPKQLDGYFDEVKHLINSLQSSIKYLPASLLKFALIKPFIDKVIIGVNNAEHLKHNVETLTLAEDLPLFSLTPSDNILIPAKWPKLI